MLTNCRCHLQFRMSSTLLCMLVITALLRSTDACTALAISPGATEDSCSYTTTTSDCKDCDFRLAHVPARQFPKGSKRPVYLVRAQYPHLVSSRARTWNRENLEGVKSQLGNWTETRPMGFVPQVRNTFALYESGSGYGLVNEHMVSIGESTCPTVTVARPISDGGKALFDVSELTQLALERATSAKEAIQIIGEHAEKYGYYGAEWNTRDKYLEGGEALTISDKDEAWVFHILADDTGASAVWAAQRVPDGHITVVANYFIIRKINSDDTANFMHSSSMYAVATRLGRWTKKSPFDFAAIFGKTRPSPSYVTLRMWRVFTIADPALATVLNSITKSQLTDYPFSIKPARPLSARDLMQINRDYFAGTPYDLTKGPAAGPYGDPDRYDSAPVDGMSRKRSLSGEFARGISLFRTSYTSIARGCSHLPREVGALLYFAQGQPDSSSFLPLYVHSGFVPRVLSRGSLFRFNPHSYYWQVTLVSNWVHRYYMHAMPMLREVQKHIEKYHISSIDALAERLLAEGKASEMQWTLALFSQRVARFAFHSYVHFFPELVARVHDGFIMEDPNANDITMSSFFYPEKWLKFVGYFDLLETRPDKRTKALRAGRAKRGGARKVLDLRDPDSQFEETSYVLNFASGVVLGAAVCFALVYTLTDFFKSRTGYSRIRG